VLSSSTVHSQATGHSLVRIMGTEALSGWTEAPFTLLKHFSKITHVETKVAQFLFAMIAECRFKTAYFQAIRQYAGRVMTYGCTIRQQVFAHYSVSIQHYT